MPSFGRKKIPAKHVTSRKFQTERSRLGEVSRAAAV